MNADVYLFGDLGNGYTQYIDDNSRELFKSIASKSKANSQLVIHRDDTLMYYSYVRRLQNEESSNNRYIGISYVLNNRFIYDIDGLFAIFEGAITTIVSRGVILEYTDDGKIVASVGKLYNAKSEFAHISAYLKNELDSFMAGKNDALPPLDYSISTSERKTFTYKDAREEIISALSTFPTVYIFKDENCENEESKSFSNKLSSLNKKNISLQAANDNLRREKKRTTIVTILSIVVAVGIIIIIGFANRSSEQGRKIESQERDIKGLNEHVNALAKDSSRFEKELSNANNNLRVKENRISSLESDVTELKDEINELKEQLTIADRNIKAYQQTIDQQKKQIEEKEQIITNLRNQKQTALPNTSQSQQIKVVNLSVASFNKYRQKNSDYGANLYSSDTYYLKVRIGYTCKKTGKMRFMINLLGPTQDICYWSSEREINVNKFAGSIELQDAVGRKEKNLPSGKYKIVLYCNGQIVYNHEFYIM